MRRYALAVALLALLGILVGCAREGASTRPQGTKPETNQSSQGANENGQATGQNGQAPNQNAKAEPFPRSDNIVVTELLPGEELSGSFTVRGEARVFEANVQWEIEDGHDILGRGFVTAAKGAPEWGQFEIKAQYKNPSSPNGMIILFTESAKDGSRQDIVMIPVKFDPLTVRKDGK